MTENMVQKIGSAVIATTILLAAFGCAKREITPPTELTNTQKCFAEGHMLVYKSYIQSKETLSPMSQDVLKKALDDVDAYCRNDPTNTRKAIQGYDQHLTK